MEASVKEDIGTWILAFLARMNKSSMVKVSSDKARRSDFVKDGFYSGRKS